MVERITSVNNIQIKETAKLLDLKLRKASGKFLIEGYKAISEALNDGIKIEKIFVNYEKTEKYNFENIIEVTESVLKKISSTSSAPVAVAVGIQKVWDKNILKNAKKVALFENIKDVGNLGTILRSASAFEMDAIILFGETVDLYNPKVVRSAVGNFWKIPVFHISDIKNLPKFENRIATLPKSDKTTFLKDFNVKYPTLIMFGAESDGLSDDLKSIATDNITIEMSEKVESLNLSISAAIVFYKLFL